MNYKSDYPDTKRRLTALWNGERLDRPYIAITAPQVVEHPTRVPSPANTEARWLDPDYRIPLLRHVLESAWWGGEAIPGVTAMYNWVICLGGTPRFDEQTIWFDTIPTDFSRPPPFRNEPVDPWVCKHRRLLAALCKEAGHDAFLIGQSGGLPANDLLSMLMGTETFLLALMDHPEWMHQAITQGAREQVQFKLETRKMIRESGHAFWYGHAGWMSFWAPEPFVATQSDVSCMLSPEQYDRFVLPELEIQAEHGPLWYHLDGGDARQHLPRLLSLPFLRVLQYTPAPFEPCNGPDHLEMYRRVQAAGKIVHIELPWQYVEPLCRQLDPALLMLQTHVPSRDQGERLLQQSAGWI